MKSCDIKKVLLDFEESESKAILINGKWGVGKTFQVNEYIKDYEQRKLKIEKNKDSNIISNVYYISIFGFKSTDEIHTNLYNQMHPFESKVRKIGEGVLKVTGLVSKAVKLIPGTNQLTSDIISNSLEFVSDNIDVSNQNPKELKKTNNIILIFDDLERTSINYIELLGYFNQLIFQGIHIVCLCNIDEIAKKKYKIF